MDVEVLDWEASWRRQGVRREGRNAGERRGLQRDTAEFSKRERPEDSVVISVREREREGGRERERGRGNEFEGVDGK